MANKKIIESPEKDRIRYFRMALALCQISVNDFAAELIIETWDKIQQKGGSFNIEDSVNIEWRLRKKYKQVEVIAKEETPMP